jgi:hypothetical protein
MSSTDQDEFAYRISRLENELNRRIRMVTICSPILALLLLAGLFGGVYMDLYYRSVDGYSFLLAFPLWPAAMLYMTWLRPRAWWDPDTIYSRIVSDAISIAFVAIYLLTQCLILTQQCTDPAILAIDPVMNYVCTTGYAALIVTIVYASVMILMMLAVAILDVYARKISVRLRILQDKDGASVYA